MQFNTDHLYPWADFMRIIGNARKLRVTMGRTELSGDFEMDIDDHGTVSIAFGADEIEKPKRKARKGDE